MDFNRLQTFHAVARRLSFSKAAEDLYTSQPNVSRQIAVLEGELGLPLFLRVGNRVALTDAGRMVEDYAQRTFELTDGLIRALNELEGLERGYLRLAAGSTSGLYLLPQAMAGFQRQHPGLEVTLYVSNSQEALARVVRGETDIAFVDAPLSAPAVQVQPYATDELVLVATPGRASGLERLDGETLLVRELGSGTRQVTDEALAQWDAKPARQIVVNHSEALKQAVMAGMGLAFISRRAIASELQQRALVIVDENKWRIRYTLSMAARKDLRPPMTALSFMSFVRKQQR